MTRDTAVGAVVSVAVVVVGMWVQVNQGVGMLWFYSTAVTAIVVLLFLMPYAANYGHRTQGVIAVWSALVFGPLSLIVLVPWARSLGARSAVNDRGSWP